MTNPNQTNFPMKSQYDIIMEQFELDEKVTHYTVRQSLEIIEHLNSGIDLFLTKQAKSENASQVELRDILLNA